MSRPPGSNFGNYLPAAPSSLNPQWRKIEISPETRRRMWVQSLVILYPRGVAQSVSNYCESIADIMIEKGHAAERAGLADAVHRQIYGPLQR